MTKITEVLSVSSAASTDKEMPGEGIRISTDTIYRLRLISVAGWFASNAELRYTCVRGGIFRICEPDCYQMCVAPVFLNNTALKKKPVVSSSLALAGVQGERSGWVGMELQGACRHAAGALRSSLVHICAGSDL